MLKDHRILIVNDDGVYAPGINLLERIIREHCDDVWVIAPDEEKSGASHQVSMHVPIRLRKLEDRKYAVKGSPTDCVLMALHELMDEPPTLVLSGINRGSNLAEDIHYSGTIAVAIEAALMGLPSIAFSQVFTPGEDVPWETAEALLFEVVEKLLAQPFPPSSFVNVNFPSVPADQVSGVRVVAQGRRAPGSFKIDSRVDNRGVPYFWVHLVHEAPQQIEATDLEAIEAGAVSICPMTVDMSHAVYRDKLAAVFE